MKSLNKNKVKEPKKAQKAIEYLHEMVDHLRYFYHNNDNFKKHVLKKAIYVEDVIRELGVDKKIDHARFISKFKDLFGKQVEELKEENRELKEELKERGKIIGELVEENKELVEQVIMECEEEEDVE
jgi:FtsZ-binding cell division protein ZapB